MSGIGILRGVLATYRLARLIQQDDIVAPLRDKLMVRSDFAYGLLSCQPCVGVWAAAIVVMLQQVLWLRWLADVLAIAGGQVFLFEWGTKEKWRGETQSNDRI